MHPVSGQFAGDFETGLGFFEVFLPFSFQRIADLILHRSRKKLAQLHHTKITIKSSVPSIGSVPKFK